MAGPFVRAVRREPWSLLTVATTAVIAWSVGRALARGYRPVGDNALIELRAWDVFSTHLPLLGSWSSASIAAGHDVNHPGPLLFDLFAVPVHVFGGRVGIAVGAALLNAAAVWGAALVARQFGGRQLALVVAFVTAVLAWSMGSELLYDVWQPNILVLPFLAFLVLVWAALLGRSWALPVAVGIGSLCMQTHISYVLLVPALLAGAVATLVVTTGRRWFAVHGRNLLIAFAVGLLAWAQPLWEQLFAAGEGNISRLLRSSGTSVAPHSGLRLALRMVAAVVAVPPAWAKPGYDHAIPSIGWTRTPTGRVLDLSPLPSLTVSVLALVVLVGLLVAVAVCFRRRDVVLFRGALLVLGGLLVAVVSTAVTPIDDIGLRSHAARWLWPLGALGAAVLLHGLITLTQERRADAGRVVRISVLAAGGAVSVLTLPTYRVDAGPDIQAFAWPAVAHLRAALGPLEHAGTVLFDPDELAFAEPFSTPLMAEMAERGISFVVADASLARQVGPARLHPERATVRVFLRLGAAAEEVPPGATRLAFDDRAGPWGAVALYSEPYASAGV